MGGLEPPSDPSAKGSFVRLSYTPESASQRIRARPKSLTSVGPFSVRAGFVAASFDPSLTAYSSNGSTPGPWPHLLRRSHRPSSSFMKMSARRVMPV